MNFPNKSNWNQRNKTNPSKNLNENNSSHSKKTALKTNCESISTSESEDVGQHFVRLSALKLERIKLLPVMQEVRLYIYFLGEITKNCISRLKLCMLNQTKKN